MLLFKLGGKLGELFVVAYYLVALELFVELGDFAVESFDKLFRFFYIIFELSFTGSSLLFERIIVRLFLGFLSFV